MLRDTIALSSQLVTPLMRWLVVVLAKVNNAPLAGLEANAPVNVSVALLFVSSKDTPPDAIVYVPDIPATVNVSPASGVLWIAAITNVVPVWDAPCATGLPYGGTMLESNLVKPSILL